MQKRVRTTALATALTLLPAATLAQSTLDRMEAVSEKMNAVMVRMMADEMIANGADPAPLLETLPDMAWDDEMRAAGACMLTGYTDRIGEDGVEEMIANIEQVTNDLDGMTLSALSDEMAILPDGITEEQSVEITQSCGMVQLQMKRMQDSGFAAAMMSAAQGGN